MVTDKEAADDTKARAKELALKLLPANASMLDLRYAINQLSALFETIATNESDLARAATEIAALRRRVEQMEAVVKVARDVAGAYDAACFEGLPEVIAETTDERLKDLVMRRITWHHAELNDALVALSTPTGSDNAAPLKPEGGT